MPDPESVLTTKRTKRRMSKLPYLYHDLNLIYNKARSTVTHVTQTHTRGFLPGLRDTATCFSLAKGRQSQPKPESSVIYEMSGTMPIHSYRYMNYARDCAIVMTNTYAVRRSCHCDQAEINNINLLTGVET